MAKKFNSNKVNYLKIDGENGRLYRIVAFSDNMGDKTEEQMVLDGFYKIDTTRGSMWVEYFRSTDLGYVGCRVKEVIFNGGSMDVLYISIADDSGVVSDIVEFPFTGKYGLSRFGQIFSKIAPNIDRDTKYEISFHKEERDGRNSYSIFIKSESGTYLKYRFNKDNLPEPKQTKDFKGNVVWDYSEVDSFLLEAMKDTLVRLSPKRFNTLSEGDSVKKEEVKKEEVKKDSGRNAVAKGYSEDDLPF